MRLSVYLVTTLKDKPKDYRGLTSENWHLAKDEPAPLSSMVITFLEVIAKFYLMWSSEEELNAELDKIAERCSAFRF